MITKKRERVLKEKENEWQRDKRGEKVAKNDIRRKKGRVTVYERGAR